MAFSASPALRQRARRTLRRLAVVLALLPVVGQGQSRNRQGGGRPQQEMANVPYDGRYTFVRVKYDMLNDGGFGRDIKWAHDYPRGERHFTKIIAELSTVRTRTEVSNIFTFDDPEIFKYPIAYMAEPGFWNPSESEVLNMRKYIEKGGFLIFDDFAANHWMNFERQMQRVLPKSRPVVLTTAHPIFDSFYRIDNLNYNHPYYGMPSVFYGIYEDNDPSKRLVAIVNYNNDLSEYWEFSDEGMFQLEASNQSYKLGINYIIYALTR
jgi:hypothetical protein